MGQTDFVTCEQQRHRPDCAFAKSDQRLLYLLSGKYNSSVRPMKTFNTLASLCSWAGLFRLTRSETSKTGFLALWSKNIWTTTRENMSSGVCEQHRRRPACTSAQSDQCLCYKLSGKYNSLISTMQNFNILASLSRPSSAVLPVRLWPDHFFCPKWF